MLFLFVALKVLFFEISQLAILDRNSLVSFIYTFYLAVKNIPKESSKSLLIMLSSIWISGLINDVVGVNFRCQLPLLPLDVWVITENYHLKRKTLTNLMSSTICHLSNGESNLLDSLQNYSYSYK